MKLLTKPILKQLIENFNNNNKVREESEGEKELDLIPVVKFFGGSSCTWLITEFDEENDTFFGLCDIGHGSAELGYVSREELFTIRFQFGLPVERDRHFYPDKTISKYAEEAKTTGGIYNS